MIADNRCECKIMHHNERVTGYNGLVLADNTDTKKARLMKQPVDNMGRLCKAVWYKLVNRDDPEQAQQRYNENYCCPPHNITDLGHV
jgi:hypothetical protein